MTYKEAIKNLENRRMAMSPCIEKGSCKENNQAIDIAIKALRENEELKEHMKVEEDIEFTKSYHNELTILKLKEENEELKEKAERGKGCEYCRGNNWRNRTNMPLQESSTEADVCIDTDNSICISNIDVHDDALINITGIKYCPNVTRTRMHRLNSMRCHGNTQSKNMQILNTTPLTLFTMKQ